MSEIKRYQVTDLEGNVREVEFICSARNTRNGFAHDAEVFIGNCCMSKASAYYLNRTWEYFRYQTAMRKAVSNEIDWRYEHEKSKWLEAKGFCKLTAKRKIDFEKELETNVDYDLLLKIYKLIER